MLSRSSFYSSKENELLFLFLFSGIVISQSQIVLVKGSLSWYVSRIFSIFVVIQIIRLLWCFLGNVNIQMETSVEVMFGVMVKHWWSILFVQIWVTSLDEDKIPRFFTASKRNTGRYTTI